MRNLLTVLLALSLSHPVVAQPYKENAENWSVTSAWIKEILEKQQAAAVMIALGALNQKTASLINHRQDREQVAWVLKITACGTSMLAKVATKNPAMQEYLRSVSDLNVQLIRGDIRPAQFAEGEQRLQTDAKALADAVDKDSFMATRVQYKDRLAATETTLVVYAMACASK